MLFFYLGNLIVSLSTALATTVSEVCARTNPISTVLLSLFLLSFPLVNGVISGFFRRIPYPQTTTGELVGMAYDHTSNTSHSSGRRRVRMYKAHVEYEVEGRKYRIVSSYTANSFRVGKMVRVVYNQTDPQQAKFFNFSPVWLGFTFIAVALFVMGLFGISLDAIEHWLDSFLSSEIGIGISLVFAGAICILVVGPIILGIVETIVRKIKRVRKSAKTRPKTSFPQQEEKRHFSKARCYIIVALCVVAIAIGVAPSIYRSLYDWEEAVQSYVEHKYDCGTIFLGGYENPYTGHQVYKFSTNDEMSLQFEVECWWAKNEFFGLSSLFKKPKMKDDFADQIDGYVSFLYGSHDIEDESIEEIAAYVTKTLQAARDIYNKYGVTGTPSLSFTFFDEGRLFAFRTGIINESRLCDKLTKLLVMEE